MTTRLRKGSFTWVEFNTFSILFLLSTIVSIVAGRCGADPDACSLSDKNVTLSYLLDYGFLATYASSMMAIGALLQIMSGLFLWFPHNSGLSVNSHPLHTSVRVAHTVAYLAAIGVGIFPVRLYRDEHYLFAGTMFGFLGFEAMLLAVCAHSDRLKRYRFTVHIQMMVFIFLMIVFVLFITTEIGWLEILAIMTSICNYSFLNYDRDHIHHEYLIAEIDLFDWRSSENRAESVGDAYINNGARILSSLDKQQRLKNGLVSRQPVHRG